MILALTLINTTEEMLGDLFFPLLKRAKKNVDFKKNQLKKKKLWYIYIDTLENVKLESKIWVNEALENQDSELVPMFHQGAIPKMRKLVVNGWMVNNALLLR